ncbi:hypothetical protein VTO73DRAFT_3540 [Trametes versicolor]
MLLVALGFYYLIKHKLTRAQQVPHEDGVEDGLMNPSPPSSAGHRPRFSMQDAPVPLSSPAPDVRKEETASPLASSVVPALPLASAHQQEAVLTPRPQAPASEPTPQTSGVSSPRSDIQPSFISTSNHALLLHEDDEFEGNPPPYYYAR